MIHPKTPRRRRLPRTHYNRRHNSKIAFESPEDAAEYTKKHHIYKVEIYLCPFCNFYHIGHKGTKRVKIKKKNDKILGG